MNFQIVAKVTESVPDVAARPVTLARAPFRRERPFAAGPRYIVSIFLPDKADLMAKVLEALRRGVHVTAPETGHIVSVRFSIDGSMASTVQDAFLMAFIVKPALSDDRLALSMVQSQIRSALQRSLTETLQPDIDTAENPIAV
ncbi:MAG: hypothetical protein ACRCYU_07250, partial [Nocardioides sp.]